MKKIEGTFTTNPEKAASRVAINGVMLASIFVMLAVVFTELEKFNSIAVIQMTLAIPFLFISSLAYSKIGYWRETKLWNFFGYVTLTLGNFLMINSIGLLASDISILISLIYFLTTIFLLLIYSLIQIFYHRSLLGQMSKFLFASIIITLGGILPLIN